MTLLKVVCQRCGALSLHTIESAALETVKTTCLTCDAVGSAPIIVPEEPLRIRRRTVRTLDGAVIMTAIYDALDDAKANLS
jgi:hypothetical protein